MVEKKNKRGRWAGLDPSKHPRTRRDELECDYVHKLNDAEKDWLSQFNEEFVGASFKNGRKDFHKTKKEKRNCYNRNNARNRCVDNITKGMGWLGNIDDNTDAIDRKQYTNPSTTENISLDILSIKNLIIRIACLSAKKKK